MYNTMIRGYVQIHAPSLAILCYMQSLHDGFMANQYTFTPLIKACTLLLPLPTGRSVHAHVAKFGLSDDEFIQSALIEFYSLVPDMEMAWRLFDRSSKRDVVLLTAIINGYAKAGDMKTARDLFEIMPERNVISWSAVIAGYSLCGDYEEVLSLFQQMQELGIRPNESLLVSVLTASAHLGALAQGIWVHSYVKRCKLHSNSILGTALVDMYAKCGCIASALSVFDDIWAKDVAAWNAIISGFAMSGDSGKSIELFNAMNATGVQPNDVTFIAILSSCTHSGLVNEGLKFYNQMSTVYGVEPRLEHNACVVDLLGRAGLLEEAVKFIDDKMGDFGGGDCNIWGALLNACRIHGDVKLVNRIWGRIVRMGLADCGIYVLLYNIFTEAGCEKEANKARELIKEEGLNKKAGCSFIEVNGVVEEFCAG
ncbi:pentatricopeptide repeat-containing protein ELI1, chloroplastic-like [Aristolochia californica]|uniref:pentatricopeptide repeat-containing protein ELI1, chloroplastic-like n=1 Tax=Aristolochia californica TaxID=171875 RepID=UPI0035DCB05F